jgi:hypothetical protein
MQSETRGGIFGSDEHGASAVIEAGGISGGDGAALAKRGRELGEFFERGVRTKMLVVFHHGYGTLWAGNVDGRDFFSEHAGFLRGGGFHLGAQREAILRGAVDFVLFGDILSGFAERVSAVGFFHQRVHEAPPEGRIVNFRAALEGGRGFRHHQRAAAHAFHAARNGQRKFAGHDAAGRSPHSLHPGAAEAINGRAGNDVRHPGEQ